MTVSNANKEDLIENKRVYFNHVSQICVRFYENIEPSVSHVLQETWLHISLASYGGLFITDLSANFKVT